MYVPAFYGVSVKHSGNPLHDERMSLPYKEHRETTLYVINVSTTTYKEQQ